MALLTNLALFNVACTSDAETSTNDSVPEGQWLGTVSDSDAWIAITVEGDTAAVYVCGGPTTLETHTRWWRGDVSAAGFSLQNQGWTVEVTLSDGDASGVVTSKDGVAQDFAALRPDPSGIAGLFTAFEAGCQDGVIVQSASSSQGAFCDDLGNFSQVTPATPVSRDGFDVTAVTASGDVSFFVEPIDVASIQL